ncbi:MAG: ABC transporter ATP-binding protein [Verrucomicrobiota bacterium]|jgi:oligopeptide/dipeptide ABC transporter ATP-binding protein
MSTPALLEVRDVSVAYPIWGGIFRRRVGEVRAVDHVSFTLHKGETLGLVGESGCGKSTLAKTIIALLRHTVPGVRFEGQILFHRPDGSVVDLLALTPRQMRPMRSEIQMIFQDPFSSLNPRMTVAEIVEAPLRVRRVKGRRAIVRDLLARVGLDPDEQMGRYPHEFSGGQRQRIGIARALALRPELVIADEPVSALDVSVQSQVINLLVELQREFDLTLLFVAHDLSVVEYMSDRIAVMYLGRIVELGNADAVYQTPGHPYTQALVSSVPVPDPNVDRSNRIQIKGEIPTPLNRPTGCPFRTRCNIVRPSCADTVPELEPTPTGQLVACLFPPGGRMERPPAEA